MINHLSSAKSADLSGLALLSPREMAEADRLTIASGIAGTRLMESAGAAVAARARAMWRGGPVTVLAGPGNNGGDGYVAARLLRDVGHQVTVLALGKPGAGDAAWAAASFNGVVRIAEAALIPDHGLIIDALYGAGVRLPLARQATRLIRAVNRSPARVLSVDLASGVEGSGGTIGDEAIRADETVTFFRLKPGHLLLPGRPFHGRITVADIGIDRAVLPRIEPKAFQNEPGLWREAFPQLSGDGHKYDRGHLVVLAGPPGFGGAARLAARAGLRIGAGLVTVAAPEGAMAENAAALDAIMLRQVNDGPALRKLLEDRRMNALAIGPGLGVGEGTLALIGIALASATAVVLDADAITSAADNPKAVFAAIRHRRAPVVLTPHEGEFKRLFPDLAGDRLGRARSAAKTSGAIVVFKGADTVVAGPDGRAAIADNGPPDLATAGSGDVLCGMVAGLLARGMPAFEAAAAAVWLHGECGLAAGKGLIAEDLPEAMPKVLAAL